MFLLIVWFAFRWTGERERKATRTLDLFLDKIKSNKTTQNRFQCQNFGFMRSSMEFSWLFTSVNSCLTHDWKRRNLRQTNGKIFIEKNNVDLPHQCQWKQTNASKNKEDNSGIDFNRSRIDSIANDTQHVRSNRFNNTCSNENQSKLILVD